MKSKKYDYLKNNIIDIYNKNILKYYKECEFVREDFTSKGLVDSGMFYMTIANKGIASIETSIKLVEELMLNTINDINYKINNWKIKSIKDICNIQCYRIFEIINKSINKDSTKLGIPETIKIKISNIEFNYAKKIDNMCEKIC